MSYQFSLKINNERRPLTPINGVDSLVLGTLIRDLKRATDPKDGSDLVLYQVSNHGYTPNFTTISESRYERYVKVHNHLVERGIEDLVEEEAKYARTIKRLFKKGFYLEPFDVEKKRIARIYPSEIKESIQGYYSTTTVYGIISLIGSQNLEKMSYLFIDGQDYKIYITAEQDIQLRNYYRESKLAFKVRHKRSLKSGKVVSATLLSFKPIPNISLVESIYLLIDEDLKMFNEIDSQDDLMRFLGK